MNAATTRSTTYGGFHSTGPRYPLSSGSSKLSPRSPPGAMAPPRLLRVSATCNRKSAHLETHTRVSGVAFRLPSVAGTVRYAMIPAIRAVLSHIKSEQCETSTADATLYRCSGCRITLYCSIQCQARNWRVGHKALCKNMEKSSQGTF